MLIVKYSIPNAFRKLTRHKLSSRLFYFIFLSVSLQLVACSFTSAQDNSPYSRYGLGDIVPITNVGNRGMGGIAAGYSDPFIINFTNPASYSSFKVYLEEKSKKVTSGRVVLDVGINFDSRTLKTVTPPAKFTASNALFSYIQVGLPVKNNWGVSFGLRPISRISYKIVRREKLFDPITNSPIDSAFTEFSGDGGSFLASMGTGFAIKNFSAGANFGYLFGKKEYATKRALFNDSVSYNNSNHTSRTSFGDIYFNGGSI